MAAFNNLLDQASILDMDLTPTEKLVAVVLLSFRNAETGKCNPPIFSDSPEKKTICSRSGFTRQCVMKAMASLEKKGVIACTKQIARPSDIRFTVNDDYGKQRLPLTTITPTVNDDYGNGKRRLPITNKEQINKQIREQNSSWQVQCKTDLSISPLDLVPNLDLKPEEVPQPAQTPKLAPEKKEKKKAVKSPKTFKLPFDTLPEQWAELCKQVRPDLNPQRVFINFRFYFTEGRGAGTMRSERGWNQSWSNWIAREKEGVQGRSAKGEPALLPPHKDPAFHFDDKYYEDSILPDGTTDWGV